MRTKRTQVEKPFPVSNEAPPTMDLRALCRSSDRCIAVVRLMVDSDRKVDWLVLGAITISAFTNIHFLEARMVDTTDISHSAAPVLRLPLIGLHLSSLPVQNHVTRLEAWIDPNAPEDFRVPRPGYDPRTTPGTFTCTDCEHPHPILPDGRYLPDFDPDLYGLVRGKKVEIRIRPVFSHEEAD